MEKRPQWKAVTVTLVGLIVVGGIFEFKTHPNFVLTVSGMSPLTAAAFLLATVAALALVDSRARSKELSQLNAALRETYNELEERVRMRTAALTMAKGEAERANLAKSEFLSRMSHELRTPMNSILGFAQLLELDELNPPQREAIGHILRAGRYLLVLINEVLDLARIEAGRMAVSLEAVDVTEVVRETLDLVQPLANSQDVELFAPAIKQSHVRADSQRLKQVLLNLLSNAIKYNRPRGKVMLRAEPNDGRVRISVQDTGIGFSPEQLDRLFSPFERLGAENSLIEGTGLGLAVTKGLVEVMEGTIGVYSVLGEGTTFWVELLAADAPILEAEECEAGLDNDNQPSAAKRLVLHVEDNPSSSRLVEHVLMRRSNIELLVADGGIAGLDIASGQTPDLILLDSNLPDIPGEEFLRRLRSDRHCQEIPVIILSADSTPGQKERLLAGGALDYLTKPLEISRLLKLLDQTLCAHSIRCDHDFESVS